MLRRQIISNYSRLQNVLVILRALSLCVYTYILVIICTPIRFSSTWKKKVMSEREKTLLTQEIVNARRRAKPGIVFAVIKKDSVDLTGLSI